MGFFSNDSEEVQVWNQFNDNPESEEHKAKLSHELIAGAAAFEAEKAYADHCERNGKPQSHEKAKELLAAFAGAFIDREVETKGLDFIDKEEAKRAANRRVEETVTEDVYVSEY